MSEETNIGERLPGELEQALEQALEADLKRAMALVDRVLGGQAPREATRRVEKLAVAVELLKVAQGMPKSRSPLSVAPAASDMPSQVLDLDDDRAWLGADTLVHVEELDEDDVRWDELFELHAQRS